MFVTRRRRAYALTALAFCMSCESGIDPEPRTLIDLVLDFCANDVPVWIAYQNEGADWVRLTPNSEGSVSFTATNDVALAFVHQIGTDYTTEIIYAANFELDAISGRSCKEEAGTKTVHGTVSGVVGAQQLAQVGMSYSAVYLTHTQTAFSLTNLPDRPLDLIASRTTILGSNQQVDRLIIRRNQSLVHNATVPVLDFNSTEALEPVAFSLAISGLQAGEQSFLMNTFVSQLETAHVMSYTEPVPSGENTVIGVAQQDLAPGDYHDAFVIASDGTGAVRGVERYFLGPSNQSLVLGPPMGVPAISEAATAPYLRLRTELSRGSAYPLALRIQFTQEQPVSLSATTVFVTVTNGYQESGNWDATIPDLSGVSGWQNSWGLVNNGSSIEWSASVYSGRPELLFGAPAADGEVIRFAGRSSTIAAREAGAFRTRTAIGRSPRPFGPRR